MCQETERNYPITKQLIQTWYMRHVFKDLRGSWRCITFAGTKAKKSYQSQKAMARRMNLQRASARAAASRNQQAGGSDKRRWMFKTFSALYSNSQRKSRTKDTFSKLKNLVRSNSFDSRDPVSSTSSSLAELIPCVEFDLDNVVINSTDLDSDFQTTGEPPSRRSSDSFLSCNCDSSTAPGSTAPRSPFRAVKQYRRKRSISAFRAAKLAISSNGSSRRQGPRAPGASGIGGSKYTHGVTTMPEERETRRTLPTPENLSRGTSMTMDTSSSPCKSNSPSWVETYDILTDTLSTSSWSTSLGSNRQERSRRAAAQLDDNQDWLHRQQRRMPSSRLGPPTSREDLQRRKASAIDGALHTMSGKDFQEALVDIILQNDVHDLVDLEEFLQGYFRLNALYQDIIQQFFSDLSSDLMHAQVSRAPSVFARLASANRKSLAIAKAACRNSADF